VLKEHPKLELAAIVLVAI